MNEDLEQYLKEALCRQDPSPDFEARVLANAARPRRTGGLHRLFMPTALRWAAAAVLSVLVLGAIEWRHEVTERAAGEAAKARLQLALKITSAKLRKIQDEVNAEGRDQ